MCVAPILIRSTKNIRNYSYDKVPCGKCHECLSRRAAGWAFRLNQQDLHSLSSFFITLSLADENLIYNVKDKLPELHKPHLQKLFKRIRKNTYNKTLKYYAVGEYGTLTQRPHYHAIVFNCNYDDIENNWHLGHVHFGDASGAAIRYVTNYVMCKNDDYGNRMKPFSLMSKGLGIQYLTSSNMQWHLKNMASYVTLVGGQKQAMPRYYRDKIFDSYYRDILTEYADELRLDKQRKRIEKHGEYVAEEKALNSKIAAIASATYRKKFSKNKI